VRRALRAIAAAAVVALLIPAAARADGDPASDVLLTDTVYLPYTPPSAAVTRDLRGVIASARSAGTPLRVAVIAARRDLGAVPDYYARPGEYARFLSGELGALNQFQHPTPGGTQPERDPLIVVMPAGFGTSGFPPGADAQLRDIDLSGDVSPDGLAKAAGFAVQELAKKSGHPIAAVFKRPPGSGGGGGSALVPLLVGLGLLVLAVVAVFFRLRAQSPGGNT
jgi:hypothetical protein